MRTLELAGHKVLLFDELPSTNTYMRQNVGELSDGDAVIAQLQTAGRGRQGNVWQADSGMLALSVLYSRLADPVFMTIISAVAVCRTFESLCELKFGIKWTNDIICNKNKVCGILCESVIKGSDTNGRFVICGMGLNLEQSADFFQSTGLYHAASVYSLCQKKPDKLTAAESVLKNCDELLSLDRSTVIDEYRSRCITLGKEVSFLLNGENIRAFAKSIDMNGALVCENENGEFTVNAGEVRVRTADGEYI